VGVATFDLAVGCRLTPPERPGTSPRSQITIALASVVTGRHLTVGLAGNTTRCTAYLMGNHTIAEQMYRHDPAVMLYVPLRTVIYAGPDDRAFFAADQPSTQVASFGLTPVTQVGIDLDRKLAALLDALDVPASEPDSPA